MAEQLTAKLSVQLAANLTNALALSNAAENMALNLQPSLASAGRLYSANITTSGTGSKTVVNLYSFGGAVDNLGQTFALADVYLIVINNHNATKSLTFINDTSGDPTHHWTANPEASQVVIPPNGLYLIAAPNGLAVTSSSYDIAFFDDGTATVNFDLVILGA